MCSPIVSVVCVGIFLVLLDNQPEKYSLLIQEIAYVSLAPQIPKRIGYTMEYAPM